MKCSYVQIADGGLTSTWNIGSGAQGYHILVNADTVRWKAIPE